MSYPVAPDTTVDPSRLRMDRDPYPRWSKKRVKESMTRKPERPDEVGFSHVIDLPLGTRLGFIPDPEYRDWYRVTIL